MLWKREKTTMPEEPKRYHDYNAEAEALSGDLTLPLMQEVKPPTYVKLNERGGYLSQHVENYRLGGVVSFRSAYTQVGGNPDTKPGHGWNTLTTSVIEGLNVLDIVTADRIVCQISTDHPPIGYVPTVTFLGTRFENLRIAGHQVKLELDLDMLGAKPKKDARVFERPGLSEAREHSARALEGPEESSGRCRDLLRSSLIQCRQTSADQMLAGQPGGRRVSGSKLRPCDRGAEFRQDLSRDPDRRGIGLRNANRGSKINDHHPEDDRNGDGLCGGRKPDGRRRQDQRRQATHSPEIMLRVLCHRCDQGRIVDN